MANKTKNNVTDNAIAGNIYPMPESKCARAFELAKSKSCTLDGLVKFLSTGSDAVAPARVIREIRRGAKTSFRGLSWKLNESDGRFVISNIVGKFDPALSRPTHNPQSKHYIAPEPAKKTRATKRAGKK